MEELSNVLGNLINEVCTLVLVNELSNPLSFSLAGVSQCLWVSFIWKAEIKMMSRVFNVDRDALIADLVKDTTSMPWVEGPVAENDV